MSDGLPNRLRGIANALADIDGQAALDCVIAADRLESLQRAQDDFGIRSNPPCQDCDEDGHCTMNCGPITQ